MFLKFMKSALLVCILPFFCYKSVAQKVRFTESTNTWTGYYFSSGLTPAYAHKIYYYYQSDTVKNGISYKVLRGYYDDKILVREDTLLKKVLAILPLHANDTIEKLLYDYTLNIGDTFRNSQYSYYVYEIDSVLINTTWHKVWYFHNSLPSLANPLFDLNYLEGVGSLNSPLATIIPKRTPIEGGNLLTCFNSKGLNPAISPAFGPYSYDLYAHPIYFDNTTSCTNYFVGTPSITKVPENISIYPNPAQNQLSISMPVPIKSVSITNPLGNILLSENYNAEQVIIDISNLTSGIYFIRINGAYVSKFVKD